MTNSVSEEKLCLLALHHTSGLGPVIIKQLISYCGDASSIFKANYKKLIQIPGIGEKTARIILAKKELDTAENELSKADKAGYQIVFYTDAQYPHRLKPLYDAPLVIYTQGHFDANASRTIGIVGTRKPSDYGLSVTEDIIRDLVPFNPLIISGLAYGIDITAHKAAVRSHIPTIGVMASGLDVIYPASHKKTAMEMLKNGGLLTENPIGTKPDFNRFPARNRIIAGMSDVIIVVESAKKGGSLITVEFAGNYHRDIYAVPGQVGQPQSEGCNHIISENKAAIFTSVDDLITHMNWETKESKSPLSGYSEQKPVFDGFSQEESKILSLLHQHKVLHIDEIAHLSSLYFSRLSNLLLALEFQGIIKSLPGKKYQIA